MILLGVPFESGQSLVGPALGARILGHCFSEQLPTRMFRSFIESTSGLPHDLSAMSHYFEELAATVQMIHQTFGKFLAVGGDHSVSVGTIGGLLQSHPNTAVVWVDAHGDMNNPTSSPSGNFHGMPLACLLGQFGRVDMNPFGWLRNFIAPERLILLGTRSLDPGEIKLIHALKIRCFPMHVIRKRGMKDVMNEIVDVLGTTDPIHLSLDIDAVDPTVSPSTGTPVSDGLQENEVSTVISHLHETGSLNSMDLVEFNPLVGSPLERSKTFQFVQRVIRLATDKRPVAIPLAL